MADRSECIVNTLMQPYVCAVEITANYIKQQWTEEHAKRDRERTLIMNTWQECLRGPYQQKG